MEELVMMFGNVYKNRSVLVTGHTGFKGSWLVLWLQMLGAKVTGISLPPETSPNHWDLLGLDIESFYIDIRDESLLRQKIIAIGYKLLRSFSKGCAYVFRPVEYSNKNFSG